MELKKSLIVVHSGGMDSSICLAQALKMYPVKEVLAITFDYGQRHQKELKVSEMICQKWSVDRVVFPIPFMKEITNNSLTHHHQKIDHHQKAPNTLVVGRNGLMAQIASIHAHQLEAKAIMMGVIGVEAANSGYRDCSREYMDKMQEVLRIDFNDQNFKILTPLVAMTKEQTLELAHSLGVLEFLLENTITCYEGIEKFGCGKCPSCQLRNEGIKNFVKKNPKIQFSYRDQY